MSTQSTIYLDYASTTPVDPRVASKMMEFLTPEGEFGNPASRSHRFGWKADEAVEQARSHVANLVNCDPREIVWTSGATEADNLAIKGVARFYKSKGNHIITSKIEHKAVLDPCRQLEREGFEVTYLDPDDGGVISPEAVKSAMKDSTEIDLTKMPVDLMSFSAHKTYGPKGIGALYVRRKPRVRLEALIHGGGHERGMRSGTLATHQIVGMGEAFRIAKIEMEKDLAKVNAFHKRFLEKVEEIDHIYINGDLNNKVPNILNVSFNFVEGESLIMGLKDIAVSSGSACTSASLEPSYVGRKDELAHSSIRFSFGRFTSDEDVDNTLKILGNVVHRLRELSPLWEMHLDGIDLDTVEWNTH